MYRNYENPYELKAILKEAQAAYNKMAEDCLNWEVQSTKWDVLADQHEYIEELKERINFAWQDEQEDDY